MTKNNYTMVIILLIKGNEKKKMDSITNVLRIDACGHTPTNTPFKNRAYTTTSDLSIYLIPVDHRFMMTFFKVTPQKYPLCFSVQNPCGKLYLYIRSGYRNLDGTCKTSTLVVDYILLKTFKMNNFQNIQVKNAICRKLK